LLLSLCYLVRRRVLQLAMLRCRSDDFKELEIIVLRHELAILRRRTRRPVMTPAERFVWTVCSECLDWLLILNPHHLERILHTFINHYNGHWPHRALRLNPPEPTSSPVARATTWSANQVQRRDRLGGVVHEYARAA
jgi:Integrase core domain